MEGRRRRGKEEGKKERNEQSQERRVGRMLVLKRKVNEEKKCANGSSPMDGSGSSRTRCLVPSHSSSPKYGCWMGWSMVHGTHCSGHSLILCALFFRPSPLPLPLLFLLVTPPPSSSSSVPNSYYCFLSSSLGRSYCPSGHVPWLKSRVYSPFEFFFPSSLTLCLSPTRVASTTKRM